MSVLPVMEANGVVYKVEGKRVDPIQALKVHGFNCVRLRLWVNPSHVDVEVNDLPPTIALAKRVKRAGLLLLLDIHYSDTWAAPSKQFKPGAWKSMPFATLTSTVHDYTKGVIASMANAGVLPGIVQVGNEITGGMLWPDGKDWGSGNGFDKLAVLLKSGIQGVKDGAGRGPTPSIMIHIDRGGDWKGTRWFFDGIVAQKVPFDIIGESYYPQFHGPMSQLRETLRNAAARYRKPIIVAETAYPFEPIGRPLAPSMSYPVTPAGQWAFLRDLVSTVASTPSGLGRGVVYWEPDWLPTKKRGAWNTTALFDDRGNALPAFDIFAKSPKVGHR